MRCVTRPRSSERDSADAGSTCLGGTACSGSGLPGYRPAGRQSSTTWRNQILLANAGACLSANSTALRAPTSDSTRRRGLIHTRPATPRASSAVGQEPVQSIGQSSWSELQALYVALHDGNAQKKQSELGTIPPSPEITVEQTPEQWVSRQEISGV